MLIKKLCKNEFLFIVSCYKILLKTYIIHRSGLVFGCAYQANARNKKDQPEYPIYDE
jgi:hypothetical protein